MAIEKVKEYFRQWGMEEKVREFDASCATVELAAKALNCEESRIAKTLAFHAGERILLIVVAGDVKVDNIKFKEQFGAKAKMLSLEEAEPLTGHAVGGVCPFAVKKGVEVYLDKSLDRFATVYPACGSANSAIELTVPELEYYSMSKGWVDICRAR